MRISAWILALALTTQGCSVEAPPPDMNNVENFPDRICSKALLLSYKVEEAVAKWLCIPVTKSTEVFGESGYISVWNGTGFQCNASECRTNSSAILGSDSGGTSDRPFFLFKQNLTHLR